MNKGPELIQSYTILILGYLKASASINLFIYIHVYFEADVKKCPICIINSSLQLRSHVMIPIERRVVYGKEMYVTQKLSSSKIVL